MEVLKWRNSINSKLVPYQKPSDQLRLWQTLPSWCCRPQDPVCASEDRNCKGVIDMMGNTQLPCHQKHMRPSNMSITLEQVTQTALKFICINFVLTIFHTLIFFS